MHKIYIVCLVITVDVVMGIPLTLPQNIPLPFWLTVRVRLTPVHPADFKILTIIASKISNTKLIAFNSISEEKSTSWKEERRKVVKIIFQYIYTTQANSLCAS